MGQQPDTPISILGRTRSAIEGAWSIIAILIALGGAVFSLYLRIYKLEWQAEQGQVTLQLKLDRINDNIERILPLRGEKNSADPKP